jgi:hypothetical protein
MRPKTALDFTGTVSLAAVCAFLLIAGCSAIDVPNPGEVIRHPLGTESVKLGMTKQQVEELWGKPSEKKTVENKEKWQGGGVREVWIYRAQYSSIPVDAGYLSKTKKLYFDGENLTDIGE